MTLCSVIATFLQQFQTFHISETHRSAHQVLVVLEYKGHVMCKQLVRAEREEALVHVGFRTLEAAALVRGRSLRVSPIRAHGCHQVCSQEEQLISQTCHHCKECFRCCGGIQAQENGWDTRAQAAPELTWLESAPGQSTTCADAWLSLW